MSPPSALRVTMSARAVVATGQPFAPRGDAFADADVARDEISSLRTHAEPLLLRVEADGGSAAERGSVEGDWLCDSDGSEPRRLPAPRWARGDAAKAWAYDDAARAWARARTWFEAWEECEDARWMMHAAASVQVERRLIVLAACSMAESVSRNVRPGDQRPRQAIMAAVAWASGKLGARGVRAASIEAMAAREAALYERPDVYFAAASAEAACRIVSADPADLVILVGSVAHSVAVSASDMTVAGERAVLRELADRARRHIPTVDVLRAVAPV